MSPLTPQEPEEAPTCEQHGTMVADDEMGRAWHCAVCGAASPSAGAAPPQDEPDVQLLAWAVTNCHMLARRALARTTSAYDREKWEHVLRICEKAGARSQGVLRAALPTEITDGEQAAAPASAPPKCAECGTLMQRLANRYVCANGHLTPDETLPASAPPVLKPIPAEWADAANAARGLCESEANRWETASPKTAAHWRSVATRLGALYLTQDPVTVPPDTAETVAASAPPDLSKKLLVHAHDCGLHGLCAPSLAPDLRKAAKAIAALSSQLAASQKESDARERAIQSIVYAIEGKELPHADMADNGIVKRAIRGIAAFQRREATLREALKRFASDAGELSTGDMSEGIRRWRIRLLAERAALASPDPEKESGDKPNQSGE